MVINDVARMKHGMLKSIYKCNVSFREICLMTVPKYLSFVGRQGSERLQGSGNIVTYEYIYIYIYI
jgi:hypothetical protein